jgi:hypothetical protein
VKFKNPSGQTIPLWHLTRTMMGGLETSSPNLWVPTPMMGGLETSSPYLSVPTPVPFLDPAWGHFFFFSSREASYLWLSLYRFIINYKLEASKSHTHPSHSTTSRLLSSSISLGCSRPPSNPVYVRHVDPSVLDVIIKVFHHTDTPMI